MREFILRNPHDLAGCLGCITALDLARPWRVEVKRYVKRRSLAQNRLWWLYMGLVARCLAHHTGDDWEAEDVHEWAKAKWCPPKAVELGGDWVEVKSTRKLSTEEFTMIIEKLYHFCVQAIGLILPTPGLWEECNGDMALVQERMGQ